jgi:phosphoribosylaminoimidazole-succinocarboxamide synthase
LQKIKNNLSKVIIVIKVTIFDKIFFMSHLAGLELRKFLLKQKHVIKVESIARAAGSGQRLRRFLAERDSYLNTQSEVNIELVKLYESLHKYLHDNKIIQPKGLFK